MTAIPFLFIWFCPMGLFSTGLRDRKRRMTIGDAMILVGAIAVDLAMLLSGSYFFGVLALLILYLAPFLLAVLYFPRRWDLVAAWSWSVGMLIGLFLLWTTVEL